MSVGVSKRNCDVDEYNARIGEEVAFSNAVRALCMWEEELKMPDKEYERMLKRMYPDGD